MVASDHLSGYQFDFTQAKPNSMSANDMERHHTVEARSEIGTPVGSLTWHHKTGEIKSVVVDEDHRRRGVATELMSQARTAAKTTRGVPTPKHSADRTAAGSAWAKTVGGRVPSARSTRAASAAFDSSFRSLGG
jgi:GNAT superfamily N-acetyltransferase